MSTQKFSILTVVAALATIALPQQAIGGACVPQITQVHGAVCYEPSADTLEYPYCQLHIQGECLEPFDVAVVPVITSASVGDGNGYRVLIADGDGVMKQAFAYPSDVLEATDLHYRLLPAIVQCGTNGMTPTGSIENRLVKLQKLVKIGKVKMWTDLDSKFVTFTCVGDTNPQPPET